MAEEEGEGREQVTANNLICDLLAALSPVPCNLLMPNVSIPVLIMARAEPKVP